MSTASSRATSSGERRFVAHDRGARRWLWAAVLTGFGAVVALVIQLVAVAFAVAGVFLEGRQLEDVLPLLATAFGLLSLRALLGVIGELAARRSAERLVGTLRSDLTAHLLHMGPAYRRGERSGEVTATLTSGLGSLEAYVTAYLPARRLAVLVPVLVLLTVLLLDPPSVLVLVLTGPLLLLLLSVIGGRTRSITERRFLEMRTLSAFFLDILRGIATLKLFGRSREQVDTLRDVSRRYGDTTMEVLRTAFQTSLVLEWGATIAIALVAVEVGLRLLAGAIQFERALAVLLVTPEFFLPLRQLAIRYHVGTAGKAVIERVFEILDAPPPAEVTAGAAVEAVADRPAAAPRALVAAPPRILFDRVSLTYPGRTRPALEGVSLELPSGQMVALVGESGAGKSTLADLLLRFIEPGDGRILVDDRRLDHIHPASWRAALAWVPQRPHLFHGSVAENIRLARRDASDAEIVIAARAANAEEFIERLPSRYETAIGEGGTRLSGGQRQRIAIARAFLRDAPLLILDEATSYQDERGEAVVADALDRLVSGRTTLVISHRLRLAQRASLVVVLSQGRVVETGTPDDLLAQPGRFRALLEAQGQEANRWAAPPGPGSRPHHAALALDGQRP